MTEIAALESNYLDILSNLVKTLKAAEGRFVDFKTEPGDVNTAMNAFET